MKRNLLYFICPFKHQDEWRQNVAELFQYLDAFNHRRIVTISQGKGIENAGEVQKMFEGKRIEFIEVENDPILCETRPFVRMLNEVQSVHAQEISFYAHAKGVSYERGSSYLRNIQLWRRAMYYFCLNDMRQIDSVMQHFNCCGCFKRSRSCKPYVPEPWHFSGTFFWFNHQKLYSHPNWAQIKKDTRWAVEGYLATLFEEKSAYCLFGENKKKNDTRSPKNWNESKWNQILSPYSLSVNSMPFNKFVG